MLTKPAGAGCRDQTAFCPAAAGGCAWYPRPASGAVEGRLNRLSAANSRHGRPPSVSGGNISTCAALCFRTYPLYTVSGFVPFSKLPSLPKFGRKSTKSATAASVVWAAAPRASSSTRVQSSRTIILEPQCKLPGTRCGGVDLYERLVQAALPSALRP